MKPGLSPPVKYFTDRSKAVFLLWIFYVFSVLCFLCLCELLFICVLWSPAGKGLTSWLSFVVFNCELVTFPLESWVRCGTWLYRFLIFAPLLSLTYCQLYLALTSCRLPSTVISVNNQKGRHMGEIISFVKVIKGVKPAVNYDPR